MSARSVILATVLGLALAAAAPSPARAGLFTDGDARVFTLAGGPQPPWSPGIGRIRALPDGSVVFVDGLSSGSAGRLWRLGLDGRPEALSWAGRVAAIAADASGRLVVMREGSTTIERLDLADRRRTVIADLARVPDVAATVASDALLLAVLDDGVVVVAAGQRLLRVAPTGTVSRLRSIGLVRALAPAGGGAFAALLDSGELVRVAADGRRRRLASGAEALTAIGDGEIVTALPADNAVAVPAIIGPDGATVRHPWAPAGAEHAGDGRTAAETRWSTPNSLAVASDGSLVMASVNDRVRALVPADSPRARIAILSPDELLTTGRLGYVAGTAGHIRLEVYRDDALAAAAERDTGPGTGELVVPAVPPPDLYTLRLTFSDGPAQSEASAQTGVRTTLTMREVEYELAASLSDMTTGPEHCRRLTPAAIDCVLYKTAGSSTSKDDYTATTRAAAIGRFSVVPYGGIEHTITTLEPPRRPLALSRAPAAPQRLGAAIHTWIASSRTAVATVRVLLRRRDDDGRLALAPVTRTLAARQRWKVAVRLSPEQRATVSQWLRRGLHVVARIEVTLESGTTTVIDSHGVPLTR